MNQPQPRKVIGTFELVEFPEFHVKGAVAKIDTGAYTGALHCTNIKVEKTPEGRRLHFAPLGDTSQEVVMDKFAIRNVKSSNGENQKRYFVSTYILVRGEKYPISITLADRSEMRWPVLIGRRFLRHNHFLVDVSKNATYVEQIEETV